MLESLGFEMPPKDDDYDSASQIGGICLPLLLQTFDDSYAVSFETFLLMLMMMMMMMMMMILTASFLGNCVVGNQRW